MKTILKAVLALVVILIALVLLHPVWIGPVVRTAGSQLAPKFLGVPAKLDGFSLNAYTGRVTLDGFVLENPPGCPERNFVTIGNLTLDVNPTSLMSDPIIVEEISLRDLYVSLVSDEKKVYNYETVAETCSPASSKAKEKKPETKPAKEKKPGPKVIIDLIQVQTALVQWQRVSLPLPSFRLTGIGRGANGVEFEAAWKEMELQFVKALGPLASGLQAALSGTGGSLEAGLKGVNEVTDSVDAMKKALDNGSPEAINSAAKSLEKSVKSLKSLFK